MPAERRGRSVGILKEGPLAGHCTGKLMPAAFLRMRSAAQRDANRMWNNLMHQVSADLLERTYHALDGNKARGVDGISKAEYGKDLTAKLGRLVDQLHKGGWKPKPARRVTIPKADGKERLLAVSCVEDKVVQKAVADILTAIYEPVFEDASHGFRPHRGAHTAIQSLYHWLADRTHSYVVDIDIENFFDTIDHQRMMEILRKRISDGRFRRLIWKLMRAGIQADHDREQNNVGLPQGSIISPILANIYLHEVVDQWVGEQGNPRRYRLARYADDMVICCGSRTDAENIRTALQARLEEYKLRLHPTKSGVVEFGRKNGNVFNFLGFTWYWGKDVRRKPLLKLKTQAERFRKAISAFTAWVKGQRNRKRLRVLWKEAEAKLRGHYAYYGIRMNDRLGAFYWVVCGLLYKWLNRRSQKRSFSWAKFQERLKRRPLPKPWGCDMYNIAQRVMPYAI